MKHLQHMIIIINNPNMCRAYVNINIFDTANNNF